MALYLITGGCGFIGSHLAEHLLQRGQQVRILDNLSSGKMSYVPDECEVVIGDVTDRDTMEDCFNNVDYCFHLAAVSSVQLSNLDWQGTHKINQTGSIQVFEAARLNKTPVVYASSAAVYGDNADMPLKESALSRPLTAYGADKSGTELHARVASLVHSVPTSGLRLFNVYGPRQDPCSPYSGVISIFANKIMQQQPISIYGSGDQVRDFIYVTDVVKFLLAAMKKITVTPAVFNICSGRCISIKQLANTMMSIAGRRVPIEFLPSRRGDIQVSVGDPGLSQLQLGALIEESLASGLHKLLNTGENFKTEADVNSGAMVVQCNRFAEVV